MPETPRTRDADIGQSAIGMVRCFGDAAEREALARARKFEKSNNQEGFKTWTAIAHMIRQGRAQIVFQEARQNSAAQPMA